jgi:hypothetical protein
MSRGVRPAIIIGGANGLTLSGPDRSRTGRRSPHRGCTEGCNAPYSHAGDNGTVIPDSITKRKGVFLYPHRRGSGTLPFSDELSLRFFLRRTENSSVACSDQLAHVSTSP